ncbi:MAG: hypothetical protein GXP48_10235 [Acidobacteria bacterium]|nr:hypothetical protein [Acidobacteriota bacterium]
MIPILGSPGGVLRKAVEKTAERAIAGGAPAPPWIAVESDHEEWLRRAFLEPRSDRRRGVVAVSSDRGVTAAITAGIGGAVWIPPGTETMTEAMRAAASSPAAPRVYSHEAGMALLQALDMQHCLAVTFEKTGLWRALRGAPLLEHLLAALAERIGCRFVLIEGPALFLDDCRENTVARAWEAIGASEPLTPEDGLRIAEVNWVEWSVGDDGLYDLLPPGTWRTTGRSSGQTKPRPVFELPSGRQVGLWRPGVSSSNDEIPSSGWIAIGPAEDGKGRVLWQLVAAGGAVGTVPEVTSARQIARAGEAPAVRMPGWATADQRAGTPGGLLLQRLLREANANGLPLWVPNVTGAVLRRLLRLGGRAWVDGPAVPDAPE